MLIPSRSMKYLEPFCRFDKLVKIILKEVLYKEFEDGLITKIWEGTNQKWTEINVKKIAIKSSMHCTAQWITKALKMCPLIDMNGDNFNAIKTKT